MLTTDQANQLIAELKRVLVDSQPLFQFPKIGQKGQLKLQSLDGRDDFLLDIGRAKKASTLKCTYQNRYQNDIILLRLDINGPEHTNPGGKVISGNHLHIYREDVHDKYAIEIPDEFVHLNDPISTLYDFLKYNNVENPDDLNTQEELI